jgi:hypothetical protein
MGSACEEGHALARFGESKRSKLDQSKDHAQASTNTDEEVKASAA